MRARVSADEPKRIEKKRNKHAQQRKKEKKDYC
ncbi:unnamed protein product, partial [marine sediment metagenome]